MRKRSHVYQLWSHSCTHCVRITGLHALRRSRSDQPLVRIVLEGPLEGCGRCCQGWTSRYGGLSRMVLREARGFSTGLCEEAVLHRCSLVSRNMVCERSTRCVRLPGAHARHRSRIAQPHCAGFVLYCATSWPASYCCDCEAHDVTLWCDGVSRMLVVLAKWRGVEGRGREGCKTIDLSMNHHMGGGEGGGGGVRH